MMRSRFLCLLMIFCLLLPLCAQGEEENDSILLSFVGDCSIGDSGQYVTYGSSYHTTVREQGYDWPFSLVKDYLTSDDLTVANLEVVFTNRKAHADKVYYLRADPAHVQILKEGGIDIVNTVNNHCMDYLAAGYRDTLDTLDEAGIPHFGYTTNHDDLATVEIKGIRIGFIGISYPKDSDKKRIANRVSKLREEENCDLVFLSLHWGRETHATPENTQIKFAKELIDMGIDLIWGHHPHVTQPIHFYKGKPILYSTGNFTFGTMSQVDPSTGIFRLSYQKTADGPVLSRLQVIPCKTQPSPDFRPIPLTDPEEILHCYQRLVFTRDYPKCENLPASFLQTGIVEFQNGEMVP